MFPRFLLPETVSREDGAGAAVTLDQNPGAALLTLGIDRVLEQESLDVSVWGSPDGRSWQPLASFPQKSYCGAYSLELNLGRYPDVRFLRAQWRMGRWATTRPVRCLASTLSWTGPSRGTPAPHSMSG